MELKVINDKGEAQKPVDASETLFGRDYNEALVHQVVVAYQANGRQGTRAQKTRAEVRHSTKKPWRQKGTGRARAGMTSSPLWRGGGRIFPNKPDENFTQKLNRKMYRAGMAAILSQLVREDRLSVIEAFSIDEPKTKLLAGKLRDLGMDHVLILTDELDDNLYLSSRNLPNVLVLEARHADPVSLMRFEKVLVTKRGGQAPRGGPGMNQERLMKVIVAPVISEKATLVGETRKQVVFQVLPDATKAEIKAAVELLFKEQKVQVGAVNVRQREGQGEAPRALRRPPQDRQEGVREPHRRRRHQLRGRSGLTWHSSRPNPPRPAAGRW